MTDLKIPDHPRFVVKDWEVIDRKTNHRVELIVGFSGEICIHTRVVWCRGAAEMRGIPFDV